MGKLLISMLFAFSLLLPPALADEKEDGKEAKDEYGDSKDKSHKIKKEKKGVKHQLEVLREAISDINDKVEDLGEQLGELPDDLAEKLAALQAAVDANTGDISLALNDIIGILMDVEGIIRDLGDHEGRLDDLEPAVAGLVVDLATLETTVGGLESRIVELEGSTPPPPPGSELIFSGNFVEGAAPNAGTTDAWKVFVSDATGLFKSIKIRNSFDGGTIFDGSAECTDEVAASAIAAALNTFDPSSGSMTSVTCQGLEWNVGPCITGQAELNARPSVPGTSDELVCQCDQVATVRPLTGDGKWGGVGSIFGGTGSGDSCSAQDQTLEVVLTRP